MAIRRREHAISHRRVERLATTALVVFVALWTGVPKVLGMASPSELSLSTTQARTISVSHIAPGDSLSETVELHNYGPEPLDYQLVFVREGDIWNCDPGGNNLHYEVAWSPGAERHLEPGETETATVTVVFPRAAGNACQGKKGLLTIRRGYLHPEERGGVYECRPFPFARLFRKGLQETDDLKGHYCARAGWPLYTLLNR